MPIAASIAEALLPQLIAFIEQEIADGQKSAAEATKAALQRLANEQALAPVLPVIEQLIADARKPPAEPPPNPFTP